MPYPYDGVTPLHTLRCKDKVNKITDSMRRNGWVGHPLLVIRRLGGLFAVTGSHRIAAARRIHLPLKRYIVNVPLPEPAEAAKLFRILLHPDLTDQDRYDGLLELRKHINIPNEAVEIMKYELDKHTRGEHE